MVFFFSGSPQVLDRVRKVAADKNILIPVLLDTKGPEIRTAMLKDHKNIELEAGQSITVVSGAWECGLWRSNRC